MIRTKHIDINYPASTSTKYCTNNYGKRNNITHKYNDQHPYIPLACLAELKIVHTRSDENVSYEERWVSFGYDIVLNCIIFLRFGWLTKVLFNRQLQTTVRGNICRKTMKRKQ